MGLNRLTRRVRLGFDIKAYFFIIEALGISLTLGSSLALVNSGETFDPPTDLSSLFHLLRPYCRAIIDGAIPLAITPGGASMIFRYARCVWKPNCLWHPSVWLEPLYRVLRDNWGSHPSPNLDVILAFLKQDYGSPFVL
ncbi:hypothetical protein BHM03_00020139 [Ensete ventricosum]|nr:hypothetical protein BHM03_00020139 [Ensete ventricosum]